MKRSLLSLFILLFSIHQSIAGTLHKVSQSGGGTFTTIQGAVNAAKENDTIIILDTAIYEEQVTFDSTRNSITLKSADPTALKKPCIQWKDAQHTHPVSCQESRSNIIDFDHNGALRLIGCSNITIDGIRIDGKEIFPFGSPAVWPIPSSNFCIYPLQHGNSAICLFNSKKTELRNCDVLNSYFGIYIKDRNGSSLFSTIRVSDNDYWQNSTGGLFGKTGGHIIEQNKIHHNSWGMFFESCWDLGTIVRYNCIYENHHPSANLALTVKNLTTEGTNQPGGAILFKDVMATPVAIYNNTFRYNHTLIAGGWQPGNHYLLFNNIFDRPHNYLAKDTVFPSPFHELTPVFVNRMHNSVYAAQVNTPAIQKQLVQEIDSDTLAGTFTVLVDTVISYQPRILNGINDVKAEPITVTFKKSDGSIVTKSISGKTEGNLITYTTGYAFPKEANVRWLETKFKSDNPESPDFTVPEWNDSLVKRFIIDQGWAEPGITDGDKSEADLGAIPQSMTYAQTAILNPTRPALITNTTASLQFDLACREPLNEFKVTYLKLIYVKPVYDGFGGGIQRFTQERISDIQTGQKLVTGTNDLIVTIPQFNSAFQFALFEIAGTGTTVSGKPVSTLGYIPYRNVSDSLIVSCPGLVTPGQNVAVKLKGQGKYSSGIFKDMHLVSNGKLSILDTNDIILSDSVSFLFNYCWNIRIGALNNLKNDTFVISGTWLQNENSPREPIQIKIPVYYQNGAVTQIQFTSPLSKTAPGAPAQVPSADTSFEGSICITDRFGTAIPFYKNIVLSTSDTTKALFDTATTFTARNDSGFVRFPLRLKGRKGESVKLFAILTYFPDSADADSSALHDTAEIRFGTDFDRLHLSLCDSTGDTTSQRFTTYIGSRVRCLLWAGKTEKEINSGRSNTISIHILGSDSLRFYRSATDNTRIYSVKLLSGKAEFWISSKNICSNSGIEVIDNSDNTLLPNRIYGIDFKVPPVSFIPKHDSKPVQVIITVYSLSGKKMQSIITSISRPFTQTTILKSCNKRIATGAYIIQIKPNQSESSFRPLTFKTVLNTKTGFR